MTLKSLCRRRLQLQDTLERNEALPSCLPASSRTCQVSLFLLNAITVKGWHSPTGSRMQQIRGISDHLRLNCVPFFELLDQPLSVFPRGLDNNVITLDTSADSPRLFGAQARARLSPAQANLLLEASKLAFPVLSGVTGAVPPSPSGRPHLRIEKSTVPFWLLDAASELHSLQR